jgi:hypothetical protein
MADFIPQNQVFTVVHGRGVHQYAATPTQWTPSPAEAWHPSKSLVSDEPANEPFKDVSGDLDASHVPSDDFEVPNIVHDKGPFARALDCPEHTSDCEVCADDDVDSDADDLSDADFGDLDGDDKPQDGDYSTDPDEDHIDDSHVDGPVADNEVLASRGIATVPTNYGPPRVVPFRARAGAVNFAGQPGPVTFTR